MALTPEHAPATQFEVGACRVDLGTGWVCREGKRHRLDRRALQVLALLVAARGRLVSRQEILAAVWEQPFVSDDVLVKAVGALRRALGDSANDPTYIQTIRGEGYRLVAAVAPAVATAPHSLPLRLGHERGWRRLAAAAVMLAVLGAVLALGLTRRTNEAAGAPSPTVTVLPFACPRPDGPDCRLAAVLAEAITAELARQAPARVSTQDEASLLLHGAVWPSGPRVAVSLRAVSRASGRHLWADRQEVPRSLALAAVGPLATTVAHRLRLAVPTGSAIQGLETLVDSAAAERVSNCQPDWSPDGRWITFVSDRDGNDEIYLRRVDHAALRRLTFTDRREQEPAWSPDGRKIAFTAERDGDWDIYLMELATGTTQRLTHHRAASFSPRWSPDGATIVFTTVRDGDAELYAVGVDGTGLRNLTRHPGRDVGPVSFSRDGSRIAFSSDRANGRWAVYAMDWRGEAVTRLTYDEADTSAPRWSPDGRFLVYKSQPSTAGSADLLALDLQSAEVRPLLVDARSAHAPSWSPDGSRLAFHVKGRAGRDIYVLNVAQQTETRLTFGSI